PPTVVQRGLDSHFVYRLKGDKVEVVPVQVLYQNSDMNILQGVQAGDVLVSDGQSRLKAGAQVDVLKEPPQVIQTVDAKVQP
ncbi:MAG: efflux RND transporter periplasmic adaptor subunit, partial [Pseudomonadota bacterium]|nr:efflux RND transporter periplasmic adaptor subunit [Pseudomonadota bacterium]